MSSSGRKPPGGVGNRLLELLPPEDLRHLLEHAEHVRLALRTVVAEVGEESRHVYFPLSSVFSAIVPLNDGSAIEAGTIGNEGFVGIEHISNPSVSVYQCLQQIEGESLRFGAREFHTLLKQSGRLSEVLGRYLLTIVHQASQTAACNARHSVDERMCRWLLMTHDRVGRDEFYLTQEFLGIMLGVRRQSVSLTASTLQRAGLITYSRGHMRIVNRQGIERSACECYGTVRGMYERVMLPEVA